MKQIVAFDFDGTLLDSRNRHIVVMQDILDELNIKLDVKDLITFKSNGKNNVDYLVSKGINKHKAQQIQKIWIINIELDKYLETDILYDDAIDMLDNYSTENDLILITARENREGVKKQIEKFKLDKYFKEVFVVKPGQSASEQKAEILKEHKAVLMVGDTASDAKAARLADIDFKFHENGFHAKEVIGK